MNDPCAQARSSYFLDNFAVAPVTDNFVTLTATPVLTPEPQSLVYVLTGVAGSAGAMLRRRVRRCSLQQESVL